MRVLWVIASVLLFGCPAEIVYDDDFETPDSGTAPMDAQVADAAPSDSGFAPFEVPASPQRMGDPATGYTALVNDDYVGCGVPYSAYSQVFGPAPESRRIPGRNGNNETLAYDFNAFTAASGVEVVSSNCLTCHAAAFEGEVVIGLGDANRDFTGDTAQAAEGVGLFISDPAERMEWRKWADRIQATAPYIQTQVVGVNPADNLAAILFAHRDPITLAWSPTPLMDPPPNTPLPVDVPPWWRVKKKHGLYYSAAGRGDHARLMMTASVLCVDDVAIADAIDAFFPDVQAYINTIEAPPYPRQVDQALAAEGEIVFDLNCARCHGTYGPDGEYPNLVIPLEEIETDPWLAQASFYTDRFSAWLNMSYFGEIASLEPTPGYIAPPLDGIWLTAPYLHNGSVPDIRSLLDSDTRPDTFTRSYSGSDYDYDNLGWPWQPAVSHAEEPDEGRRKLIYDTGLIGYGNTGHTFGDDLTEEQRTAVIEYLKTL